MVGITTKTIYATAALYQLSFCGQDETLKIKDIAEKANIPQRFLEQILLELKKKGILISTKGAFGGYKLAKPLEDIKLRDIMMILENDNCSDICKTNNSVLKLFWKELQTNLNTVFDIPLSEFKKYEEKINQTLNFSI
ncbi:MAG: Rrf2 family transcriptional regulator [Epsilonproteobacteria bacterium]|nr:Rrf2 family transcriptional regulator [Campylobacterota bacterium]